MLDRHEADPGPEVAKRLREWRRCRAYEEEVPVYVILPNALVYDLARALPQTTLELELVRGMNPQRVLRYGDAILNAINPPPLAAGTSLYRCMGRCHQEFIAMLPAAVRQATGTSLSCCGTAARWLRDGAQREA